MVSAFPGGAKLKDEDQAEAWLTVSPILKYGERLHNRFLAPANGCTPLAETLWWTFQQMQSLKEERKIVLILSDGEPNDPDGTLNVINILRNNGLEIYGIGIGTVVMENLMSGKYSRSIYNLKELAPAMLDMLKVSLFDCRRSVK